MPQRYYFEGPEDVLLDNIPATMIDSTVQFIFDDAPIRVKSCDMLELDNGEWFLIKRIDREWVYQRLSGKWDRQ